MSDTVTRREFEMAMAANRDAIVAVEKSVTVALDAHNREHESSRHVQEMAVTKADDALTARLESMNQFRNQITDERGEYLTKSEFQRVDDGYLRRFSEIGKSLETISSFQSNLQGRITIITAIPTAVALIAAVLAIVAFAR